MGFRIEMNENETSEVAAMLADIAGFHACEACCSPREMRAIAFDLASVSQFQSADDLRDHFYAPFSARIAVRAIWERWRDLADCSSDGPWEDWQDATLREAPSPAEEEIENEELVLLFDGARETRKRRDAAYCGQADRRRSRRASNELKNSRRKREFSKARRMKSEYNSFFTEWLPAAYAAEEEATTAAA